MLATAIVAFVGLSMMLVGLASADHAGGVAVSVSAAALSINVGNTAVLGTVHVGGTVDTLEAGNSGFSVLNNGGSVTLASLDINANALGSGGEADCSTTDWNLVASSPGTDEFLMRADTDADFGNNAGEKDLPVNNSSVALDNTNLAPAGSATVDLEITLGSSITDTGQNCPISLTVTAIPA